MTSYRGLTFICLMMLTSGQAIAEAMQWPGPCGASLQDCIDAASPGHTIEIVNDAVINDHVNIIDKSLTLRAASGSSPTLTGFAILSIRGATVDRLVHVEGLTFDRSRVSISPSLDALTEVHIRKNRFLSSAPVNRNALEVRVGSTPGSQAIAFYVEDNEFDIDFGGNVGSAISASGFKSAGNYGRIAHNTIRQQGGGQSSAINISPGTGQLDIDIIGNRITGSDNEGGIDLFVFNELSEMSARIVNNVISGMTRDNGPAIGIGAYVSGGLMDVHMVNNTVVGNEFGINVGSNGAADSLLSGHVGNNIVAFQSERGFYIDTHLNPTLSNSFNLAYNNQSEFFSIGPGTLNTDPQFVAVDDFHLGPFSAAEGHGDDNRVPLGVLLDADKAFRFRQTVDLGAFESQPADHLFGSNFED